MGDVGLGLFVICVGGVFMIPAYFSLDMALRLWVLGVRTDATVVGFTRDGDGGHDTTVQFTTLSGVTHRGTLSVSQETVVGDTIAIMYVADDPAVHGEATAAAMYLVPLMFAFMGIAGVLIGSAILVGWIPVG